MKHLIIMLAATAFSITASAQEDTLRSAKTQERNIETQEVVVTGARGATDVRHLPMTVTVLGREKLTENQQQSLMPTVMQQVPSLMVTSRSVMGYGVSTGAAGGINLRGISAGAGQLLVLIDGHPQYNGIYGHPISDSYQTLMAERVEVLRGPASVLYGSNALGGVLNIVTRGMQADGVQTEVNLGAGSYGTMQAGATNQLRSGRFTSTVSAQYNRADNHRPRMGFEQMTGYAKLGYELSDHWRTMLDMDFTHFNASYPGSTSAPMYSADQWITRGAVSASVENNYGNTSGAFSLFSNFGRHKIDDGTADPTKPTQRFFRSSDSLTGVSLWQSVQLFSGNRVTLGFDYQHIYGHAWYTSKETGKVLDTPNKQSGESHRNEVAGYIDFRQDIVSWLTLDAGLRLDHHSIVGTEWVPQAGIVVRPTSTGDLKAMVSKGFRNPTMREMYLYPPSNEELEPERIWNYELSWRHRLAGNRFTYGLNLFYLKGDNMIQVVERKNVNTGEMENWGAEMEATWRVDSHWSVSTNHSLLHMENPVLAAPDYKGFLGGSYAAGRWSAALGLQYIRGLYTAVGNKPQKENFCLANAMLACDVVKGVKLWLRGENLLAQEYEINAGYPMPRATFMAGVNFKF